MNFFKKNSKKNVELVGGDMDGIITAVQETLSELEFESLVYPSGQDVSGNSKETQIKDIVNKTKPIKTIKIIYKKWKAKENRMLYRFDRYEKG